MDERYFTGLEGQYIFDLHFLLKKQGSSSDDYLCRVRPAHGWENRSVSCEIDLEPGRYEVLPKITATRDMNAKPLGRLVEYFAEENPQKLRQVGMQYDLAHAKGGIPDEDQRIETWKVERKKKEAQRRREAKAAAIRGHMEVEVDFTLSPPSSPSPAPSPTADLEGKTPVQDAEFDDFQDAAESFDTEEDGKPRVARITNGLKKRLTFRRKPEQLTVPVPRSGHKVEFGEVGQEQQHAEAEDVQTDGEIAPEKREKDRKKGKEEEKEKRKKHERRDDDAEDSASDSDSDSDSSESDDEDNHYGRWNAVCVTCLRVYSRDPDLSISLVKPGLAEETSSLVQGGEPAGATM